MTYPTPLREEFEKALYEEFKSSSGVMVSVQIIAKFGAQFMAEAIIRHYDLGASAEINIRKLASELE